MAATSNRIGVREVLRRQRQVRVVIGRQVSDLRMEAGTSRRALALGSGIDPAHLLRIERGTASASIDALVSIAACLGADLGVRMFPGTGPRLRDRFQAPMVDALIGGLGPEWIATPEVAVPRARGVIDLVLSHRDGKLAIACECHSELRSLEHLLRRASEKAEGLRERGARGGNVSRLLLLRSTGATRDVARVYETTLAAAYPARTADAVAALSAGGPWPGAAIVWVRLEGGRAMLLDKPPRGVRLGR